MSSNVRHITLDDSSLAVASQNPLAAMVTLPLQANYNTGVGVNDRTLFNLNVQPVVPITGEDWNVIVRAIIPFNSVPQGATDSTFGIGDTNLSMFWTPAKPGKVVCGVLVLRLVCQLRQTQRTWGQKNSV